MTKLWQGPDVACRGFNFAIVKNAIIHKLEGIEAVIFDFDGTLADTMDLLTEAKLEASRELGITCPDRELVRSTNLMRLRDSFVLCTGIDNDSVYREAEALYRKAVRRLSLEGIRLFEGVDRMMDQLVHRRRLKVAIMSMRPGEHIAEMVRHTGLDHWVASWIGEDEAEPKPSPAMVEALLAELDVEPSRALTVGDMGWDVEMGLRAGTWTIAVASEPGTEQILSSYQPHALIHNITEVIELI